VLFDGNTLTTIGGGVVMVTTAVSDLVWSAFDVAVTFTVDDAGGASGAVYTPRFETVPKVELPPFVLFTDQLTDVSAAFCTVEVNVKVLPVWTVAVFGVTDTATAGPMFRFTTADTDVFATAAARITTVAGFGCTNGAV
jgi:hypothetical protein